MTRIFTFFSSQTSSPTPGGFSPALLQELSQKIPSQRAKQVRNSFEIRLRLLRNNSRVKKSILYFALPLNLDLD